MPQFTKEQREAILQEQRERKALEESTFRELARTAKDNTILINKTNPQFEKQFN